MRKTRPAKPRRRTADFADFLARIGDRVRTMRSRRGMSRKLLAKHSGVSERYLAQLEAGKGNFSILLLRRVADAISVPLVELVGDRTDASVDQLLIGQFLDRLSASDLAAARDLLLARFGGPETELRRHRVALIGMRGSGKSTLGRSLGARLSVPFVELDREIERETGTAVSEIFELFGQETFRRNERAALETVLADHPRVVLATGGSLVTEPATFELLSSSCRTVWVRATPEEHMRRVIEQGDFRPMADNDRAMDDLISILSSREPLYAKADLILDTSGKTAEQSLEDLVALLGYVAHSDARRYA